MAFHRYLVFLILLTGLAAAFDYPDLPAFLGCGIPFVLTNETRHILADIEAGIFDATATGGADLFGYEDLGGPQRWPANVNSHVVIPYCYRSETDRTALRERVTGAIHLWEVALGGVAGPTSGYAVEFVEHYKDLGTANSTPLYCFADGQQWNSNLTYNTLQISLKPADGVLGSATIGYWGAGHYEDAWFHEMYISPDAASDTVAHELGHVMGKLMHQS